MGQGTGIRIGEDFIPQSRERESAFALPAEVVVIVVQGLLAVAGGTGIRIGDDFIPQDRESAFALPAEGVGVAVAVLVLVVLVLTVVLLAGV